MICQFRNYWVCSAKDITAFLIFSTGRPPEGPGCWEFSANLLSGWFGSFLFDCKYFNFRHTSFVCPGFLQYWQVTVLTVATDAEVKNCLGFLFSVVAYRQYQAQYPGFLQTLYCLGWVFDDPAGLYNFFDSSKDFLTISSSLAA